MKTKNGAIADLLQAASVFFVALSTGISMGKMAHAAEISVVTMWIGALLLWISLSAQMKSNHEAITEKIDALRYRGLYPPKGEGSDDDVKRLKVAGEKGLALRLYLELHAVPLKEAKRAFDTL